MPSFFLGSGVHGAGVGVKVHQALVSITRHGFAMDISVVA